MSCATSVNFDGKMNVPFRTSSGLDKPKTIGIFDKLQESSRDDEMDFETDG
jgi:hypothetical protein